MQPCSKKAQHTAQKTSVSYYSRTKPKKETRASLFHSSSVITLLDKASIATIIFMLLHVYLLVNHNTMYNVVVCSPEQSIVLVL